MVTATPSGSHPVHERRAGRILSRTAPLLARRVAEQPMQARGSILFTAFEPSGDALAVPVIESLLEQAPDQAIHAWGGPRMEAAGATLLDESATDASMGLGALGSIHTTSRRIRAIRRWASSNRVLVHVAVDAPAANFPICRSMRKAGARIVHLGAPQLWAWGGWRLGKLKKLTDLVLCLLPFEEEWFQSRHVPARFIGHPSVNCVVDMTDLRVSMHGLPQGAPRLAIFPGSRRGEVARNIRLLNGVYEELKARHAGLAGVVVAANAELAAIVRRRVRVFPTGLHMTTGLTKAAIGWCDLALAVSGTVTMDIARQRKPMIGVYKTGPCSWLAAKVLLRTPLRLLPNVVAGEEIVPEFVPHLGGPGPIVHAATTFFQDSRHEARQTDALGRVIKAYAKRNPGPDAASLILQLATHGRIETPDVEEPTGG